MQKVQVGPIPQSQQAFLIPLTRDFRAALSYISFYSSDSPFVVQAVQKLHKDFQRLLQALDTVVLHVQGGKLLINDTHLADFTDLFKLFQEKNIRGVQVTFGLTRPELTDWLRRMTLPFIEAGPEPEKGISSHIQLLLVEDSVEIIAVGPVSLPVIEEIPVPDAFPPGQSTEALFSPQTGAPLNIPPFSFQELGLNEKSAAFENSMPEIESSIKTNEALLSFVAEAWQYSQLQKKNIGASPEMAGLTQSFDKLFDRLLDRMEKTSPEFKNIYQWFKSPPGELLETEVVIAMYPLMEVAVKNNWTAVLFDPTTEGLVNDCLTHWGANGKHDLVEKAVICLSEGLSGDILERQMALAQLMDARPWVGNPGLLEKVMDRLNALLANEMFPALYQSALLLAWDLMGPAMERGKEQPVLILLSTLHFHADEEVSAFPERSRIARHWLFERSTPELIRRFTSLAYKAGQLNHFPLLGEMAAPVLLKNFFAAPSTEMPGYLQLFAEMKEPTRSALAESLAEAQDESAVRMIIPILRVCGVDTALSLQLCSWVAKGSRELKLNLIGMIEEMGDAAGGPALRLALFDDSEEIAGLAARVIGKIRFAPGLPVLLKAAKIRENRFSENEAFLAAVCLSLGDLAHETSLPFLQDIARKKPLLRGKNFSLNTRLAAIEAITRINKPEAWHFVESLMEEKNQPLQEALEKIIHERSGHLS